MWNGDGGDTAARGRPAPHSPVVRRVLLTVVAATIAADGLAVIGFLVEPTASGPHPLVVNRGGNQAFGALRRHR